MSEFPGCLLIVTAEVKPARARTAPLRPPRPRGATSPMVGRPYRRRRQAGPLRQRRRLMVATALLGVTLAGLAIARVIAQGNEAGRNDAAQGPGDASQERLRCGDESAALGARGCGPPTGLAGLVWVFPSIEPASCEAARRPGGAQTWSCTVSTRSGADVAVVYRELISVPRGLNFYSRKYSSGLADRKQRAGRYLWRATDADERGIWQISSMYVDQPWAVHVEADTKKGARQGFEAISFRPVEELR